MTSPTVIGFSGNITRPSKTVHLVTVITNKVATALDLSPLVFDVGDLGPDFAGSRSLSDLDERGLAIVDRIFSADVLVVGTPTYKGAYTGLFKHLFDLLDPTSLRGKPVILAATGGGERHSLVVEHQMRPLFGFFEAFAVPTGIYASERDFSGGVLSSPSVEARVSQAVAETALLKRRSEAIRIAAE